VGADADFNRGISPHAIRAVLTFHGKVSGADAQEAEQCGRLDQMLCLHGFGAGPLKEGSRTGE
jgi:hypothetical protein